MKSEFLFIGHRGTRTIFDENTITAFEKAIEFGANCVEFDVRKTKDGELIILHDHTLDRTTKSSGLLENLSYNEIKEFRTKKRSDPIPLLSEVLKGLKGKTLFMIELKVNNIIQNVLNIINNYTLLDDCIFSGRNLQELSEVKKFYPNSQICYNITKGFDFNINDLLKFDKFKRFNIKPDFISLTSNLITKKFIEICKAFSIKSLAWNFIIYKDPISKMKSIIDLGIDGILFDNHQNIPKIKRYFHET
ncbi:MAG: glycerophosphodiester phosphodiesterase [Candidatus Hodarchaeota archaeon]